MAHQDDAEVQPELQGQGCQPAFTERCNCDAVCLHICASMFYVCLYCPGDSAQQILKADQDNKVVERCLREEGCFITLLLRVCSYSFINHLQNQPNTLGTLRRNQTTKVPSEKYRAEGQERQAWDTLGDPAGWPPEKMASAGLMVLMCSFRKL